MPGIAGIGFRAFSVAMNNKFLLHIAFCFSAQIAYLPAHSQTVQEYIVGDTSVIGQVSNGSSLDTSWVLSSIYDQRVTLPNPSVINIRRTSALDPPLTRYVLNGDTITTSEYYHNGQLKVQNISLRFGSWLHTAEYHPNGQLHFQLSLKSDSLEHVFVFFPSGMKEREYWWNGLRLFNDFTEWYEDGQVKLEAHYERWPIIEPPYRMSLPIGEWNYLKPDGKLDKIEVYRDGRLIETRTK